MPKIIDNITDFFTFVYRGTRIVWSSVYTSLAIIIASKKNNSIDKIWQYLNKWTNSVIKTAKIELEITGIENLQADTTYIVISNHSSLFDIPVIFKVCPFNVRIIYKKELNKIPIFGWGLAKTPYIRINRSDARDAMKSIDQAVASIKENISVIIFPEGTRSKDGKLGEFKRGAFMMATRSGKPILPVAISGTNALLPNGKLKFNSGKVKVSFLPPVPALETISKATEVQIMNQTRDLILNELERLNQL